MTRCGHRKVNVVSMGCSKNLVDSERIIKQLNDIGCVVVHNVANFRGYAEIINTCGFIGDAKEESINAILEACQRKGAGAISKVFVMGCLSERYRKELPTEIPEVDGWCGKFDWSEIVRLLSSGTIAQPHTERDNDWGRVLTTPKHYAYVKIAEGCNRFCAFCAIPLITGRYRSRKVEEILAEVSFLVGQGVKEFNLIAQDLSYYGRDLYGESKLAELIDRMANIEGVKQIRLHYAYPADFPYDVLPIMAKYENVCKYLDIALQHIDDGVLKNMHRHITGEETKKLLDRIRAEVPGIHIRTTMMVGFPGEDEEAFERLLEFVKEQRFERLGAFAYCEEEDTAAAREYADEIPEEVKQARLDRLMAVQQEISAEQNEAKVGKRMTVVIDREEDEWYIGRTEYDSPEVDNEVMITKTRPLRIGEYYEVKITASEPFDLTAQLI